MKLLKLRGGGGERFGMKKKMGGGRGKSCALIFKMSLGIVKIKEINL